MKHLTNIGYKNNINNAVSFVNKATIKNDKYKTKFFVELLFKYSTKNMNDSKMKIVSKVSFLEGIQTTVEVNIGWTESNKITNFNMVWFKLSFIRKTNIK